ncbi:MAG TPA: GNAT family N-acetyltransferase [Candidatus Kapabacteria bacterium]|nr:GNAT family N-acetyltransferase [Candidatus Kapabacteria bacterium]
MIVSIREIEAQDFERVQSLAASLEGWFSPEGQEMISRDIHFQNGFVAEVGSRIVGFILFYSDQGIAHIGWMGVDRTMHRMGIGTKLLNWTIDELRGANAIELRVSTLGDSVEYEPYERTRAFYFKHGFAEHQRILHDSESMPEELILRRSIEKIE